MLANHTSIANLFDRTIKRYDTLRSRNAFLDVYRKEAMFADGLEEFDSAREIVKSLTDEYKASETIDYVNWGSEGGGGGKDTGGM